MVVSVNRLVANGCRLVIDRAWKVNTPTTASLTKARSMATSFTVPLLFQNVYSVLT